MSIFSCYSLMLILFRQVMICSGRNRSWFGNVPLAPDDPILGVSEAFKKDANPEKINLGVGAYRDDDGKPVVLKAVSDAEKQILEAKMDKEYSPILGNPQFPPLAASLAFGADRAALKEGRIVTCQSISGTGALRIGAGFIKNFIGSITIYHPSPTWGNHIPLFKDAGLQPKPYRYYDKVSKGFDENGALQDIENMEEGSVILLHACAHNPTGVDPTQEQWKKMCEIIKKRKLLPFFDMAYQGFASGDTDTDAFALRYFTDQGLNLLLAQSFSKNMGLYGERVGALSVVCDSGEEVERIASQLKRIIRSMYSMGPLHGARIAIKVLSDPQLKALWLEELKTMAERINLMRCELKSNLEKEGSKLDWNHITNQIGMFCFTGIEEDKVLKLTKNHSVYLTKDGRISIAGINTKNVQRLAKAIHEVTK